MEKTIAAIATANGLGGIGVIRISGENALSVAESVFRSATGKKIMEMKGYTAAYGKVCDQEETIDEAVALVFRAPHSYTGEDVVELSCHGGLYVTKRVLRTVLKNGAVPAQAGEFTKRAFLNGKTGLMEAEAVMNIISARGAQSARAALSCMDGQLRRRIDKVRLSLVNTAAHLSAWADYPEEDIPEVDTEHLTQTLKDCQQELQSLLDAYDTGKIMREGVDTVIAGRPNVGKSTIMNLLSGCERSIVTNVPGTTRDIIEETVMLGEIPLRLSDTAGIHTTEDPVEKIGVEKARSRLLQAGLILAVFDASRPLSEDDKQLIGLLSEAPTLAIINKTDLPSRIDTDYITAHLPHVVRLSALTGNGTDELERQVADIIGTSQLDASQGVLANERQRSAAEDALHSVIEAIEAVGMGLTLDAVTVIIEEAIDSLLSLTGERVTESVVEQVFSHFCVGK